MSKIKKKKEKQDMVGFSFYNKGKEIIIQARDSKEARELYIKLLKKQYV